MQTNIRPYLVVANWKMNGDKALVDAIQLQLSQANLTNVNWVICPPFPYLGLFDASVTLAAQNSSQFNSGAHTGEVSVSMLKEFGCEYVIVGHSERREDNLESDRVVAEKVGAILAADLIPILCIGESDEVRQSGQLFDHLSAQLDVVVDKVGIKAFARIVIAYEPIWAIGSGQTASPEQAQEVHAFLREYIAKQDSVIGANIKILYGGSVKGSNARELFSQADVDGGLIGGASLDPEDFLSICQGANQ